MKWIVLSWMIICTGKDQHHLNPRLKNPKLRRGGRKTEIQMPPNAPQQPSLSSCMLIPRPLYAPNSQIVQISTVWPFTRALTEFYYCNSSGMTSENHIKKIILIPKVVRRWAHIYTHFKVSCEKTVLVAISVGSIPDWIEYSHWFFRLQRKVVRNGSHWLMKWVKLLGIWKDVYV